MRCRFFFSLLEKNRARNLDVGFIPLGILGKFGIDVSREGVTEGGDDAIRLSRDVYIT